uniref:Probable protein E5 n=1 Tax=Human papillomavirus 67 TaxID=37120 RepID=F8S5X5_HPV67|nr:early protein E5 [human papillomavirus 67]BCU08896.1 E5 protein [human papillomavirus 67]BDD37760.1 E5 protein [human papillomavirus 67]
MLAIFVFVFVLLLCFCIVLRPLLLSIYVYALLLVLVLVLWGFIGSPLRVFLAYLIFLYLPMMCIHLHAQYIVS